MMRLGWIIVFILLVQSVSAQLVDSGWFRTEDSIIIGSAEATIYVSEAEKILIKFDSAIITLESGKCTAIDNYKLCLIDVEGRDDRKAYIEIYEAEPTLKVTRTFSKTSFFIGEEVDVSVLIENTGSEDAKGIVYEDIFPAGTIISDVKSPAYYVNNTVFWKGDLEAGRKQDFEFTIQAVDEFSTYQRASIFFDSETLLSGRASLKSSPCYDFKSDLNTTNTSIGEKIGLNLTLANKCDDDVDVVLEIEFPYGLNVKGLTKINNVYRWETRLNANDVDVNEVEIIPFYAFELEFPIKIKSTYNDVSFEKRFSDFFEIQKPRLVLRTSIDDLNQTDFEEHKLEKDSNSTEELIIKVQKPNKNLYFKNITVNAETNMEFGNGRKNISKYIDKLDTVNNVNAISTILKTPAVNFEKVFFMNISAVYTTQYGQTLTQSKFYEVTVSPVGPLDVIYELGKSEINEGEINNITVKMKNTRAIDIEGIYVQDFVIFNGTREKIRSRQVDLDEGETRTLYEYKVPAPKVPFDMPVTIETVVEYSLEGKAYSFSKQTSFLVTPKKLDLVIKPRFTGDCYVGQPMNMEYVVKNDEDTELIYNITLIFPLQQEFDLIGQESYVIERLSPDEQIVLAKDGRLRPKSEGALTIRQFPVFYHDSDGNRFETSSEEEDKEIKQGYFIGPAIFMNKSLSKTDVNVSELLTVYIDIENKGEASAFVQVADDVKKWNLTLVPRERRQLSRLLVIDKPGLQTIEPAVARYSGMNETYTAVSNSVNVNALPVPEEKEIPPIPVLALAEEKIKLNPVASLTALTLALLIAIVGYVYFRESRLVKQPLIYSEKEEMWKRF